MAYQLLTITGEVDHYTGHDVVFGDLDLVTRDVLFDSGGLIALVRNPRHGIISHGRQVKKLGR